MNTAPVTRRLTLRSRRRCCARLQPRAASARRRAPGGASARPAAPRVPSQCSPRLRPGAPRGPSPRASARLLAPVRPFPLAVFKPDRLAEPEFLGAQLSDLIDLRARVHDVPRGNTRERRSHLALVRSEGALVLVTGSWQRRRARKPLRGSAGRQLGGRSLRSLDPRRPRCRAFVQSRSQALDLVVELRDVGVETRRIPSDRQLVAG